MRLPFLRKATTGGEPFVVSMTGVRLGDAVVFAGQSAELALPLAARVGLSGRCLVTGAHAGELEARATREGILVDAASDLPTDRSFELAVVEATGAWDADARAARQSVRPGGRIIVISGATQTGLLARLRSSTPPVSADAVVSTLQAQQWERVRPIGERDGLTFVEGFAGA